MPREITNKVDVYAMGLVLNELLGNKEFDPKI